MNDYEAKRQARIDRIRARADKARAESTATYNRAHDMASVIPFGQPILIGHHSEGRDRRYRQKIENTFRKSFEAQGRAEHYDAKAEAAEGNTAIAGEDPEAVTKLREKLAELEADQARMKADNQKLRKAKLSPDDPEVLSKLRAVGVSDECVAEMTTMIRVVPYQVRPYLAWPAYALSNNNANIRRVKERVERVSVAKAAEAVEVEGAHARYEDCPADNRVRLYFPGKPDEAIRSRLKSNGFRWTPSLGCWQAYRNGRTDQVAREVAGT